MKRDEQPLTRALAAGLVVLAPLVVYILTLAREITFVDGGELAAVAATLGIAHPPGYPLFTLVGHLFSTLPFGTVAFRVGLLSALATAGAALLIHRAASHLLDTCLPGAPRAARTLAPLGGGLLFAFSGTVWSQAVVVEVYGLQVLLLTAFFALVARSLREPAQAVRDWPLAALLGGAAATNHLTGGLLLPGVLAYAAISLIQRRGVAVPWARAIAGGIAPLLLYLYLPIRGAAAPAVSWDYPTTLHRFLTHATGRQYHGILGSRGLRWDELERFLTSQLPQEAGWPLLLLTAIGLLVLLARGRRFLLISLLPLLAQLAYNIAYPIPDVSLYYIPVIAILCIWAGVGAGALVMGITALLGRAPSAGRLVPAAATALAFAGALLALVPLGAHWHTNDQSDFKLLRHYVHDMLGDVDRDAVLFSSRWDAFSSPSLYYQHVEGLRPDVLVIDVGWFANPTFGRRLAGRPQLYEACREELAAMAETAELAERGSAYDVSEGKVRFAKLRRRLAEAAIDQGPTFGTGEMFAVPMMAGLHTHPEGLALRFTRDDAYRSCPVPEFEGPGMRMKDVRNDQEHEIWFEYANMLANRTRYLERHDRRMEAVAVNQLFELFSR